MSIPPVSTFEVRRAERMPEHTDFGGWRTGRVYADFVVNGVALSSLVQRRGDLISRLGWGPRKAQEEAVACLLLESPPDFPWGGGRRALYVCPEDGDLHCGAVTAVVERDGETVIWRDFGYETGLDIDPAELDTRDLSELGPFYFSWPEYESVVRGASGLDGFDPTGTKPKHWIGAWARRFGSGSDAP